MVVAASNRGKVAESKVRKELEILATLANCDYERITDAFSSRGGSTLPRPGDFLVFQAGAATLLEVKEVAHDFRLPRGNFKLDQRARMVKRHHAGCRCFVLVYSSTTKLWRMLPVTYFGLETTGSWDLSQVPAEPLRVLLAKIFQYPLNTPC